MTANQYPKDYLYKRVVQAKAFIDKNYPDKIDIDNISDEANFSKFHFIRLFKRIYGKTPHQYLTSVRIENAILLFKKGKTVSEVCYTVGFASLSAFDSLFKRTVGITPSGFLEAQDQKKIQILISPLKFVPGCFAYQFGWDQK